MKDRTDRWESVAVLCKALHELPAVWETETSRIYSGDVQPHDIGARRTHLFDAQHHVIRFELRESPAVACRLVLVPATGDLWCVSIHPACVPRELRGPVWAVYDAWLRDLAGRGDLAAARLLARRGR